MIQLRFKLHSRPQRTFQLIQCIDIQNFRSQVIRIFHQPFNLFTIRFVKKKGNFQAPFVLSFLVHTAYRSLMKIWKGAREVAVEKEKKEINQISKGEFHLSCMRKSSNSFFSFYFVKLPFLNSNKNLFLFRIFFFFGEQKVQCLNM